MARRSRRGRRLRGGVNDQRRNLCFLLFGEKGLPVRFLWALFWAGSFVEAIDEGGFWEARPLLLDDTGVEDAGGHPHDGVVGFGVERAEGLWDGELGDAVDGVADCGKSPGDQLFVEVCVEDEFEACLVAVEGGGFQGAPAEILAVDSVDEEEVGVEVGVCVAAGLVDELGREEVACWLGRGA